MPELIPVKFASAWRQYNSGEIAGFEYETAKQLTEKNIAEPIDPKTGKPTKLVAPKAEGIADPEKK